MSHSPSRNILAKIPAGMQAEVKDAYWKIFDTEGLKTPPGPKLVEIIDARISEMAARYSATYPSAMKCLTHRPRRPDRLPAVPRRAPPPRPALQLHRAHLRRDPPPHQGHRPAPRRDQLPHPSLGRPGPGLPRLARREHDPRRAPPPAGPAPLPARPARPAPATHRHHQPARRQHRNCQHHRLTSQEPEPRPSHLHRIPDATELVARGIYDGRCCRPRTYGGPD